MADSVSPSEHITPDQYFVLARKSDERLEYVHGEVVAMGQTTDIHADLAFNVKAELKLSTERRSCKFHMETGALEVEPNGRYYLPDVMLTCDERDHADRLIKRYPSLVVEVLSESSESRDRGEKFAAYLRMPSLGYYLLIAQDRIRIEVYTKIDSGGWHFTYYESPEDVISLDQLDLVLRVERVYDGVDFG